MYIVQRRAVASGARRMALYILAWPRAAARAGVVTLDDPKAIKRLIRSSSSYTYICMYAPCCGQTEPELEREGEREYAGFKVIASRSKNRNRVQ